MNSFKRVRASFSRLSFHRILNTAFRPAVGHRRELFESIFRVTMIFFLSVADSNTCDKIRTIRA